MTPKVRIISRPRLDVQAIGDFLNEHSTSWQRDDQNDGDALVEFAGRVCYMSFGDRQHRTNNREYIEHLVRQGHESVLEHAQLTMLIEGISRGCSHQLVRHRAGISVSQLSQQYHEESDAEFVMPHEIENDLESRQLWTEAMDAVKIAYQHLLTRLDATERAEGSLSTREATRAARSAARSVLPNATRTMIVLSANARAIRHFLELRGQTPGDREMRALSCAIFDAVSAESASLYSDFSLIVEKDGLRSVVRQTA